MWALSNTYMFAANDEPQKPGFKGSVDFCTLLAFDQQRGFNGYNVEFWESKSRVALKAFKHTAGWAQ